MSITFESTIDDSGFFNRIQKARVISQFAKGGTFSMFLPRKNQCFHLWVSVPENFWVLLIPEFNNVAMFLRDFDDDKEILNRIKITKDRISCYDVRGKIELWNTELKRGDRYMPFVKSGKKLRAYGLMKEPVWGRGVFNLDIRDFIIVGREEASLSQVRSL